MRVNVQVNWKPRMHAADGYFAPGYVIQRNEEGFHSV